MLKVLLKILSLTLIWQGVLCVCPDEGLMSRCICTHHRPIPCNGWTSSDEITCPGISANELVNVFDSLSKNLNRNQKHFNRLLVSNGAMNELLENTFKDITFDEIRIYNCKNLTTIHEKAFNGTELVTKKITFLNNPVLKFENKTIFDILSKFINIETIELYGNDQINEIPKNAFRSNPMNKLSTLKFSRSFTRIGSNAFSTLNNLSEIHLVANDFETIPENAFSFNTPSDLPLSLNFGFQNSTNNLGFNEKSLLHIKRPTNLFLDDLDYSVSEQYLEESIFLPFLLENRKNTIKTWFRNFDCNDYRNSWFKNNPILRRRVTYYSDFEFHTCSVENNFISYV